MSPSEDSSDARRRGRSETGGLLVASGFHTVWHGIGFAIAHRVRHTYVSATLRLPRDLITHLSRVVVSDAGGGTGSSVSTA